MILCRLTFECYRDTHLGQVEGAIGDYLETLRNNGQIIGREFPTSMHDGWFESRVLCPETTSLHPRHHSELVRDAELRLHQAGLLAPKISQQGQDLYSDEADPCRLPGWQILFTSFLHTCSPLRCGEHFAPIPLYRRPPLANGDHKQLIKWQEDWQACDQLQMNGSILQHEALFELGDPQSRLARRGRELCRRIEADSQVPTYYYLYRVGGLSLASEQARPCPVCGQPWRQDEALHDIFDFRCDSCRLVSNLSWDFKP